jgi:hypothetical protein
MKNLKKFIFSVVITIGYFTIIINNICLAFGEGVNLCLLSGQMRHLEHEFLQPHSKVNLKQPFLMALS